MLFVEFASEKTLLDLNATATAFNDYFEVTQQTAANASFPLDLSSLYKAIQAFTQVVERGDFTDHSNLMLERQFLFAEGLPKRPYYQNLIQAAGLNTGYKVCLCHCLLFEFFVVGICISWGCSGNHG